MPTHMRRNVGRPPREGVSNNAVRVSGSGPCLTSNKTADHSAGFPALYAQCPRCGFAAGIVVRPVVWPRLRIDPCALWLRRRGGRSCVLREVIRSGGECSRCALATRAPRFVTGYARQRAPPVHGPLREPYPLRERPDPATRDRSAATRTAPTAKPQARSAHAAQRRDT